MKFESRSFIILRRSAAKLVWLSSSVVLICLLFGCATPKESSRSRPVDPDKEDAVGGTFLESGDVRTIAAKMTAKILSLPEIANSPKGVSIAIAPVRNSTRFEVDKDLLATRLRAELNRCSEGRVRFFSQDLGQEVRAQILHEQDEEKWDVLISECADALVKSDTVQKAKAPVRVAVIPVKNVNLVGVNANSFTELLRSKISEKSGGKVIFLSREENGRIIDQVVAENDLRNLGLVTANNKDKMAGADFFLGGQFVASSLLLEKTNALTQQTAGKDKDDPRIESKQTKTTTVLPNVDKHLNVLLIDATTGEIPFEKSVRMERKAVSGLTKADFILTGELRGLSKAAGGGDRSDYVVLGFQLVDPISNQMIWEDIYESKRVSSVGVIYK